MSFETQTILWVSHPLLQLAVAIGMYWRKLHRNHPFFFYYLISQIVAFSLEFPIFHSGNYALYFYTYWSCNALGLMLGFKVIHEVFVDVFRPFHTLRDLGSVLFEWAGLVMLLVAAVVAASSPASDDPVIQAILTVERCVRVIQVGLIMFLLAFCKYLGVSWKQYSF